MKKNLLTLLSLCLLGSLSGCCWWRNCKEERPCKEESCSYERGYRKRDRYVDEGNGRRNRVHRKEVVEVMD